MTVLEQQETIVAQATAVGKGGVGIIRVSGADAANIAHAILGHCPAPRHAYFGNFHDNDSTVLDQGIALYVPTPHYFTREDVITSHEHAGQIII